MTRSRWAVLALSAALVATGAVLSSAVSCAATPTIPPLRSFQSAKDIDVVCMQVLTSGTDGAAGLPVAPPIPVDQQFCAPVAFNQFGAVLPYHLFALVTQTLPGTVGVVDLTAGQIIDEDPSTPGINFLPVGAQPAGIAAAPNGQMTFVTSADPNKPAIYGLPSTRILGAGVNYDSGIVTAYNGSQAQAPKITDWPACSLPAMPGPIVAVPRGPLPPDAGPGNGPEAQGYVLSVVLPGDGNHTARVVTIDPLPMLRGGGINVGPGPSIPPGSLAHCPILGETPLRGSNQVQTQLGPPWDDGVKYVIDGGPEAGSAAAANKGFVGPPPLPLPSFVCGDSGPPTFFEGGLPATALGPGVPHATAAAAARADSFLYVADGALPVIHVVDLTNPLSPKEIAPLLATSANQPGRAVTVSGLAVSPFTRDYKRYLYAIDQFDSPSSIIVYDITDPVKSPHVPLTRPHAVITPQLPLDRIQFTSPVAAVAFAAHDFPLTQNPISGTNIVGAAGSGLLCNPNANVNLSEVVDAATGVVVDASFRDPGAFYRNNFLVQNVALGPMRLRGIYGFATLGNGEVVVIDVDDWDSPCRRPVSMQGFSSDIAPPEQKTPPAGHGRFSGFANPLDPYQAPETGTTNAVTWVTGEYFFPSAQPHRARSLYAFDNDPTFGIHYPQLPVQPQLYNIVTQSGLSGTADAGNPTMFPTATVLADPSGYEGGTGVRLAWEDPLVHLTQAWTVTYEGVLPTFTTSVFENISPNPADPIPFETLVISSPQALFCRRGVEDVSIGQQRVEAALAAAASFKTGKSGSAASQFGLDNADFPESAFPPNMTQWVGDYVQLSGSIPAQTDPYWSEAKGPVAECFGSVTDQTERYQECFDYFQPYIQQSITRDFPILEAYDDRLIISRFAYPPDNPPPDAGAEAGALYPVPPSTTNRTIMGPDPSNIPYLSRVMCCFGGSTTVNVRAGGEWVAVGSVSQLLNHVQADPTSNRCVLSCDPQQSLMNARSLGFFASPTAPILAPVTAGCNAGAPCLDRNSALAMRNPMFGYFITHPLGPPPTEAPNNPDYAATCSSYDKKTCVPQRVPRDYAWEFSVVNGFTDQTVNLAGTGTQLSPQSMLFIPSLGQVAVVDGAQEGLVLIDLSSIAVSGTPYF